ncbi:MAG: 50S ribosomal protein L21 [Legionellales bacterium]|nr:50S ribosomal protein L21 [Legionellales bacterium]
MYAVFESGGKQYRVTKGNVIKLELLNAEAGSEVVFDKVLMVTEGESQNIGSPYVAGGKVKAKIIAHARDRKISIIRFSRRKHMMKHRGHRQHFTKVEIVDIEKV